MAKKAKKSKKRTGGYQLCVAGLILAVLTAFFLPQGVFALWDSYRLKHTTLGEQDGGQFTLLNLSYEEDAGQRMSNFARGIASGRSYRTTSTDWNGEADKVSEKRDACIYEMLNFMWAEFLIDRRYLPGELMWGGSEIYEEGFEVTDYKRYTIYDEDYEGGIAFSCIYLEIYYNDYLRFQLLSDFEDNTFYYMKLSSYPYTKWNSLQQYLRQYDGIWDADGMIYQLASYYLPKSRLSMDGEDVKETVNEQVELNYYEKGLVYDASSDSQVVMKGPSVIYQIYGTMQTMETVKEDGGRHFEITAAFPYEEGVLNYEWLMDEKINEEKGEDRIEFCIGIAEIGDLIPEFTDK